MVCLLNGEWLVPCAGPHVPATFKAAITPWRIGPDRASCGAAAFTKQRVIVPNISKDPRWPDDARDLTLSHGFVAAWSETLISKGGEVLGTFAMYYPEPRTPQISDFELIAGAGYIARIAIEVQQSHVALKKALVEIKSSGDKLRTIIDTIPALAWSARPDGSAEFFNRRWLDYSGLSAEEASGSGWTSALPTDDLTTGNRFLHRASQERSKRVSAVSTACTVGSCSGLAPYGMYPGTLSDGMEKTPTLKSGNAPKKLSGRMNGS